MILHTEEQGEGPPLAVLHGVFGRGRNLAGIARALAGRYRVLLIDQRNHGASPHAAEMDYPAMAGDVVETLAALGALPATVLGHSMGGKTACAIALLHPGEVARLIVADIAPQEAAHGNAEIAAALRALPLAPGLTRAAADAALAARIPDPMVRAFLLQNLVLHPAPAWRIGLAAIARNMAAIEGWPAALDGRRYDGPARFVRGERSEYLTDAHAPPIRRLFPHAEFRTVAEAGHWLHVDNPAGFLAALGL